MSGSERKKYVFVGSNMSDMMGVVSFRRFGQRAELTEEQARDLALGGSAIVPAERFEQLGFTEVELGKYAEFGAHGQAAAAFAEKQRTAIGAYDEFRASLVKAEKKEGEV